MWSTNRGNSNTDKLPLNDARTIRRACERPNGIIIDSIMWDQVNAAQEGTVEMHAAVPVQTTIKILYGIICICWFANGFRD